MQSPASLTNYAYHSRPEISNSDLSLIDKNPHLLKWSKTAPKTETKALNAGSLFHEILLEPHLFDEIVCEPSVDKRTKAGKQELADFHLENADKRIIDLTTYNKIKMLRDSVYCYEPAKQVLEMEGEAEQSWFWTNEETGVDCRCRPDKDLKGTNILLDVKTTESIAKFKYSVEDYRYFVQDPFYCDGVSANGYEKKYMAFLLVQTTLECGRYPVDLVYLPVEAVEYGKKTYKRNLQEYVKFKENGGELTTQLKMHYRFMEKIQTTEY